ncbi:SURF1 family cytochrome oxidase biogenesis protein [Aurantiacibacter odishensis]|uniref:SURF1 family cytochrome oxidase biogenesis protein n=1 Tax=Aurantiacibacter odishensis TaxID=1155476 RepID=UPI001F0C01F3|nr:SURF1 family cytochrome oxidase biogenesis protein [Aurantiacibacter odishensis]
MTAGRVPIIPTIIVIAAAAVMVALGVWQLGRMGEKEALIAQYAANEDLPILRSFEPFPSDASENTAHLDANLFRTVEIDCENPRDWKGVAGRNADDQSGYVHMFACDKALTDGVPGTVLYATIGWSRSPQQPEWQGGTVTGILSTAGEDYEVVASEPQAGLEPLARPDPGDLPNNHLAYAGQWFFFALTALVIYFLALRRRWRDDSAKRK